jgi:hypothetical protein
MLALTLSVQAEERNAARELMSSVSAHELSYAITPVTLLRQAFASLLGTIDSQSSMKTFAANLHEQALSVDFSAPEERDRVSLILAESQVRVRLRQGLQLHCELSSTDEVDREPELGIDFALQFKF